MASPRPNGEEPTDSLFRLAYDELRRVAGEIQPDRRHTLQPTALVHDAFLKLDRAGMAWESKRHFLAVAAKAMRQVLRDHVKARATLKRGGGERALTLDEALVPEAGGEIDALVLDEALDSLARMQPDAGRVAELRILAGMTSEEVAETMGVSKRKVQLDWRAARAWLATRLGHDGDAGA